MISFVHDTLTPARFHEEVQQSLKRRRADVVEISQNMSDSMSEIHQAIIQCMSGTLSELKRANTTVCLHKHHPNACLTLLAARSG
jgi:hypothetical protein